MACNIGFGFLWLGIEFIILSIGLSTKSFKVSNPANLFRLMLITFVPLFVMFIILACVTTNIDDEEICCGENEGNEATAAEDLDGASKLKKDNLNGKSGYDGATLETAVFSLDGIY